jgi:CheY-like chemotaxis protein
LQIGLIRKALGGNEFDFEDVPNAQSALRMLQWFQPDLVLMNTEFPGFDGLQFTGRVRQATQYSQLPLLALIQKSTPSERDKALVAGFTDCVIKPINAQTFLLCLRRFPGTASADSGYRRIRQRSLPSKGTE